MINLQKKISLVFLFLYISQISPVNLKAEVEC